MRALAVLGALAVGAVAAPAAAADQFVVRAPGGRVVIEREPFRMTFQDRRGATVLAQVPNPGRPVAAGAVSPLPGGFQTIADGGPAYAPLAFEVGGEATLQQPGGLWTGNMLTGARAGLFHVPTAVTAAAPAPGGLRLELATSDPTRTMTVLVQRDAGTGIRVRATLSSPDGVSAISDSFSSPAGEAFHGFGGRHNALDQRGESLYSWVEEENQHAGAFRPLTTGVPGSGGERYLFPNGPHAAYYVQNLMVSSRPYGMLVNQTELTRWRLAFDRDDAWQVDVAAPSLDYTVALGPASTAVRTLTAITGRQRVPAVWTMGATLKRGVHQGSSNAENYHDQILDDLARLARYRLPVEGYAYEGWDSQTPEFIRQVNARLRALGIHPVGYARSYVNDDGMFDHPGTFQDAVQHGYVATNAAGLPYVSVAVGPAALIDFTNPAAVRWYERTKVRKMLDLGFDGFMLDFGEQALADMRFHDGSTGAEMHNRYPIVYQRVVREMLDRYQREHRGRGRLFFYTRSGFTGRPGTTATEDSNFPGDESTDWDRAQGLPSLAVDMLNRGIGGAVGFNTDIGGYIDSNGPVLDEELFRRWSEWAALTPFFRVHNSCCSQGTRMPWDFGDDTVEVFRSYALLHRRARPYMRRLWRRSLRTGLPLARPLWLQYPGDSKAAGQEQEWALGRDVLVAPVVQQGATSRMVYFPRGCWRRQPSGERFRGPAEARVAAPLDALPYFFRCGRRPFARR